MSKLKLPFFLFFCIFFSFSNILEAQLPYYLGLRIQTGMSIQRPAFDVKTNGGLGLGLGFAAVYTLNEKVDMRADACMTWYGLSSESKGFNGTTFTSVGEQKVKFLIADGTYTFDYSLDENHLFKAGGGIWFGAGSLKPSYDADGKYWGESSNINDNYQINSNLFNGFNYGLCAEALLNFDVVAIDLRYKHGFGNVNKSSNAWKQSFLQLGCTYYFGAQSRGVSKTKLKTKKHNW